jgi:S1-C subfamily serine protease
MARVRNTLARRLLLAAVLALAAAGRVPAATTALPGTAALQAQLIAVVKKVAPSVVQIETSAGLGSGIVFDAKGDIVTNAHVVGSAKAVTITLANGKRYQGTLVGTYTADDLAVIKITAPGLRPASFGNSSKLQVGTIVMALGNPLGFRSSVTEGIVSGLDRTVSEPNGATLLSTIQTSAAINPGNSGGALVDLNGRVIGIPTLAATDPDLGGTAAGIGFAIPSNTVIDIASQLIANGRVVNSHRAYLGVRVSDTIGGNGVLVGTVTPGGPAAKAGVEKGDVIVSVAGKPTPTTDDLSTVLGALKPGQTVPVRVVHANGTSSTLQVTLGEYPTS